ncbi:MAG: acyl-CoA dehydrogenase family protein [Dehalococcoidia bacterium]|nr:acyl-CoA dehydrogenase family protein [Dehalococcoidia bacterium]
MDFRFTPEQEAAREEYDAFFDEVMKEAPENWLGTLEDVYSTKEGNDFHRRVARMLGEKGWLTMVWPKEYGGQEATRVAQLIFLESMGEHGAPGYDTQGVGMLAPTLIRHASEEIKREFLPPIARGEVTVCQAWSEPNAGSDLAALTTRAVEDGDDFVLNGQKTWTSGAHFADFMYVIARTNPEELRHRGLSYFVLNMKETPGLTIRPVLSMDGHHLWDEVFFDDARIPKRNLVGEKNRGWYVVLSGMEHERSSLGGWVIECNQHLKKLVQFCQETNRGSEPLAKKPLVRHRLAQMAIEIEVGRSLQYRLAMLADQGALPMHEASAAKLYASELYTRFSETVMEILGLYGAVTHGSKWAPFLGTFEFLYQMAPGWELAAGSTEVQKNVIAQWGLEFPRPY